ncbi:HBR534Cp [Eremothecium sinecaudum]|uniref:HBR534Cp n=1 Tax=Eremothecium sinecaudum TaxID=45286 RepID=A0A109UVQ3_9SACH|nr:HBR534Cp [Eremothecium sinecaudum]AMD19435.1 HBR534Cp [Eremothecium sinecaudum]
MSGSKNLEQIIACPVCNKNVSFSTINDHLDRCTARSNSTTGEKTSSLSENPRKRKLEKASEEIADDVEVIEDVGSPSGSGPIMHSKRAVTTSSMESEVKQCKRIAHLPLSEKLRPKNLNEYVGQQHILSKEKGVLFKYINQGTIPSMILWGPPGVGKTSLARLLTKTINEERKAQLTYKLVETSATKATSQELRTIFENSKKEFNLTRRMTVLFIDEIHRFNKSQQDLLLPHVEGATVVLIGATTENPSFQLNNALISRCQVFVLSKLTVEEITMVLTRGIELLNKIRLLVWDIKVPVKLSPEALRYIVDVSIGDARKALNLLEMVEVSTRESLLETPLSIEQLKKLIQSNSADLRTYYDANGDNHYDTISAFHKSVRGSDENAALYYLARMLQGGEDPLFIARRMIRMASEDIGLADHSLLPLAVAAHDSVMKIGLPEADLSLAQCAVAMARAPKSVQLYRGWNKVKAMIGENKYKLASSEIPMHLRNAPTRLMRELGYSDGYKYNPDFKDGKVAQEYFPAEVLNEVENKDELLFLAGKHLGDVVDEDYQSDTQ